LDTGPGAAGRGTAGFCPPDVQKLDFRKILLSFTFVLVIIDTKVIEAMEGKSVLLVIV
jgi:hypothetical protein